MGFLNFINKSFGTYYFKGYYIEPTYWQAGAIVFLLFLLVLTFARLRFLYIHWSLGKGTISFLFYGFLLAIILEGFLILGGRTLFTEVLGWKSAPKPISTILDAGREKIVKVLGTSKEAPSAQSVVNDFEILSDKEAETAKNFICKP